MEKNTTQAQSSEAAKAKRTGTAADVKRFNGTVTAILETTLLKEEEARSLRLMLNQVKQNYLETNL